MKKNDDARHWWVTVVITVAACLLMAFGSGWADTLSLCLLGVNAIWGIVLVVRCIND